MMLTFTSVCQHFRETSSGIHCGSRNLICAQNTLEETLFSQVPRFQIRNTVESQTFEAGRDQKCHVDLPLH